MLSTVTSAGAYCRKPMLEFYTNLLSSVGDERSAKYGRVFVRNKLFSFNPPTINASYNTPDGDDNEDTPDSNSMTVVITGGLVKVFLEHPTSLSVANLTSFYYVLHKLAVKNWTPSSNPTAITRPHVIVLYSIGTGCVSFNFGRLVFQTALQFAEGSFKSSKLPYPSLIFGILESQGFIPDVDDEIFAVEDTFKIARAYFKGNRKKDLLWSEVGVAYDVGNTAFSSGTKSGLCYFNYSKSFHM